MAVEITEEFVWQNIPPRARPYLGITAARVKTIADGSTSHTIDLQQIRIRQYLIGQSLSIG